MLSFDKCKQILKNDHVNYTDKEVKEINKFLSMLAELEISIKNQRNGIQ